MHQADGQLIFFATDLSNFLGCPHLCLLNQRAALGGPKPPKFDDPALEALFKRGQEHEREYLEQLRSEPGIDVVTVPDPGPLASSAEHWKVATEATLAAIRTGADVIYQGSLFDGQWGGRPDFLRRVEEPSDLGDWSYEVVDAKLARHAKGGAVLQICLYSDLLGVLQGRSPEHIHLALGGPETRLETFRVTDYAAYYRSVRKRFEEALAVASGEPPRSPDPVEHCLICAWKTRCDAERREDDHLSLVAGIARKQRLVLTERGIATMEGLSELPLDLEPPLDGVSGVAYRRIREQARIQVEGRRDGKPQYEFLEPLANEQGLLALPEPSPGDLFFDIEGDPYALRDGIEYLFGYAKANGEYESLWALDRAAEKALFEQFIDLVMARLEEDPALHIYHFAPYEPTAMKRLMGRHATREEEVDRLLRGSVFVDLYRVVRQSLRASVESYSIKKLEPLYAFERDVSLREATSALVHFEAWLELGGGEELDPVLGKLVEGYNRDDCISTLRLRNWLEQLRSELSDKTGKPLPRPAPVDSAPSDAVTEEQDRVAELVRQLTEGVPIDPDDRSPEQQARWLLAQLLGWHRREDKSMWWEYFRCLSLSDEEAVEDRAALGGLRNEAIVGKVKKSHVHRYHFPPQDHGIKIGHHPVDPVTQKPAGEVVAVDDLRGAIELKRGIGSAVPHPTTLVPLEHVSTTVLKESLCRVASAVADHGFSADNPFRSVVDLLLRNPPRAGQERGAALMRPTDDLLAEARRLAASLDRSVLPIQGPPGAGKTYTGARMILSLLQDGRRVGITATSHKVIGKLLDDVCQAAQETGVRITGIQKCSEDQQCKSPEIQAIASNAEVRDALEGGEVRLAAGTAWLWSREDMVGSVDVLFVDEAGQLSLANTLAVAPGAGSLVMLGDPRQLEQPQQGVHPPGANVSALDHILGDEATVPPDRGLFLPETFRLHPAICEFTSEVFYEDRLRSRPGLERQTVDAPEQLAGSGLRLVSVSHNGNRSESEEEAAEVARLVNMVLDANGTWTDKDGCKKPITVSDILIVAPYNAHVAAISAALPAGANVGTVDKFQGQEAPIVIYTMATSSSEEAPRGMDFLFSGNRLNVATSRARCLTVVVASPEIFVAECRSPKQMKLANAFCRYSELVDVGLSQHAE